MSRGRMTQKLMLGLVAIAAILVFLPPCPVFASETKSDKIEITILGHGLGTSGYVLSFGLSEMINANSTRLHAKTIETKGSLPNLLQWQKFEPEKQKYTIAYVPPMYVHQAEVGDRPFERPFTGIRLLARVASYSNPLLAHKQKIQTGADFKGKRVCLGTAGSGLEMAYLAVIKEAWGLTKKDFKLTPLGFSAATDALIDGMIDVGYAAAGALGTTEEWRPLLPNPTLEKLLTSKECHVISMPLDAFPKARKATGYPIYPIKSEALKAGKSQLSRFVSPGMNTSWHVSEAMPDDVVNELCTIIYENIAKLGDYHAQGKDMNQDNLSLLPKQMYHPAAARFYEAKGKKFLEER